MELKDYQPYAFKIEGNDQDGYIAVMRGHAQMPPADKPEQGDVVISTTEEKAAKIMLRNAIVQSGMDLDEIAEKLGLSRKQLDARLPFF